MIVESKILEGCLLGPATLRGRIALAAAGGDQSILRSNYNAISTTCEFAILLTNPFRAGSGHRGPFERRFNCIVSPH